MQGGLFCQHKCNASLPNVASPSSTRVNIYCLSPAAGPSESFVQLTCSTSQHQGEQQACCSVATLS
jgi:hypothetical protein